MKHLSDTDFARLRTLRQSLHKIPEMGFEEIKTSDLIGQTLASIGVPFEQGIGGTGVVATLSKGVSGKSIGLRADIDALPIQEATNLPYRSTHEGRMHACGHDGHTTMLLGAIRALKDVPFDGTVHFIFQPAEEHGKGAYAMMEDGLFDRFPVEAVYGLHNMPWLEAGRIALNPGPIMGAEDNFVIRVRGQGGHAAMPHKTKDAMVIAASIVCELQTIVARNIDPLQGGVVSCTEFLTDGAVNVIPTEVTIKGDTRSFLPEVSELIEDRMHRIARGLSEAHGAELEFSYARVFPSTVNTATEAGVAATAAVKAIGAQNVDANCPPMMASEDFGAMLRRRPGCYAFIGNRGADGQGGVMLHNASYDFNDAIIPDGVAYWVSLVETALPV
ncbi:M20 aminoacylase family protein [Pseudooceanicola sp. C21-150M6]|uniref:M20 aminoacylase family protein n=1 Tax=Pseudooceanicola sp. C21-150M6 TaxID=3434355 RepID=UPI003D7FA6C1